MPKENHLYYRPSKIGMEKIEILRSKVIELDELISSLTTITEDGGEFDINSGPYVARARSLAFTKLEECRQRAIEAIVRLHNSESK